MINLDTWDLLLETMEKVADKNTKCSLNTIEWCVYNNKDGNITGLIHDEAFHYMIC